MTLLWNKRYAYVRRGKILYICLYMIIFGQQWKTFSFVYRFNVMYCFYSYQFQPGRINTTVALQVLLKSLTNLPKTDFVMLKCVLAQDLVS